MKRKIEIDIIETEHQYAIHIDNGLLGSCGNFFSDYEKVVWVTDSVVDELFGDRIPPGFEKIVVPSGENSKSFDQVIDLVNQFAGMGLMRNSAVVCFGGGVIGDLAGFAASIYMRGIDFFQFPTTLVAMVDSAIGGKTGINIEAGKNLVGSFEQPRAILCDLDLIANLPEKQVKDGLAEMVKHALFADLSLVEELKRDPVGVEAVSRSAQIKVDIITGDVKEAGKRKWLNVGHTVGHAIEQLSRYSLSHGAAVVKGIYFESLLAKRAGILSEDGVEVIVNALEELDLDYSFSDWDDRLDEIWEVMLHDKKNVSTDKVSMALISEVGKKVTMVEFDESEFLSLCDES